MTSTPTNIGKSSPKWSNMNMAQHNDLDRSQLFLVRLWPQKR